MHYIERPNKIPRIGPRLKEEFINQCKTDDEFAKTWGLKIEEKELSLEERRKEMESIGVDFVTINMFFNKTLDLPKQEMYEKKIPTKLITVTYKDETVEIYGTLNNNKHIISMKEFQNQAGNKSNEELHEEIQELSKNLIQKIQEQLNKLTK